MHNAKDALYVPQASVIEGGKAGDREALALKMAAAAVCANKNAPCGVCHDCVKASNGIHPDISRMGKEMELRVDDVRDLRRDAQIRPNEADRKVYIIDQAGEMNQQSQNAMLKILEEPPAGVTFLLLCENKEALLPTVLSRCALYSVLSEDAEDLRDMSLVDEFAEAISGKSGFDFLSFCMSLDKLKRERFADFFSLLSRAACGAISHNSGSLSKAEAALVNSFSANQLILLYELSQKLLSRAEFNASAAALIAELASKSIQIKSLD